MTLDDYVELYTERAAIMQHEGAMTRADAERYAWQSVVLHRESFGGPSLAEIERAIDGYTH